MSIHTLQALKFEDWQPARCIPTGRVRLHKSFIPESYQDTFRVDQPVRLTVADRGEVDAIAHRWPADLHDTDTSKLYSWWLSVGMSGWRADGRLHFNTTMEATLDCWYTERGRSVHVKLDDSDPGGWWVWVLVLAVMMPITFVMQGRATR